MISPGMRFAVHSVAQIHQGLESVFDHCRIAANHKARIGFGKLKADFFFQAAILQQFGNPFAAQCAFRSSRVVTGTKVNLWKYSSISGCSFKSARRWLKINSSA